jgi:SAM-dependent methyltransferase
MAETPVSSYTFGNSQVAAERLRILAEIFAPSSRAFLTSLASRNPARIADLGCGPGYTTRLLGEVFPHAALVGIDSSRGFLELAAQRADTRMRFIEQDVAAALTGGPYDLIYVRYLLPHLSDYRGAVLRWGENLTVGGAIASEENDWIDTSHPALQLYFEMVAAMLADRGQRLDIGAELEAIACWRPLVKVRSELEPISIPEPIAARMFVPNLEVFRQQPYIEQNYSTGEIDRLKAEILAITGRGEMSRSVTFGRRRIVWVRPAS